MGALVTVVMLNSHDIPLWTKCVPGGGQPHLPKNLQASHIIPKNSKFIRKLTVDEISVKMNFPCVLIFNVYVRTFHT